MTAYDVRADIVSAVARAGRVHCGALATQHCPAPVGGMAGHGRRIREAVRELLAEGVLGEVGGYIVLPAACSRRDERELHRARVLAALSDAPLTTEQIAERAALPVAVTLRVLRREDGRCRAGGVLEVEEGWVLVA